MFEKRTTKPTKTNKYYITKSAGGYSTCCLGNNSNGQRDANLNVLPNCVGYALGRFNEIIGEKGFKYGIPGNAEDFYTNAKKLGLKVGKEPKLGAIICWKCGKEADKTDGCGHVANVEEIIDKDTILVSESGWSSSKPFWTATHIKGKDGSWTEGTDKSWMGTKYTFVGFIYNPAVEDVKVEPVKEEKKQETTVAKKDDDVKYLDAYKAGNSYKVEKIPYYKNSITKDVSGHKTATIYLWSNEIVKDRIRFTTAKSKVGVANQITGWINVADIETYKATVKVESVKTTVSTPVMSVVSPQIASTTNKKDPDKWIAHTVRKGDTLWNLAVRYYGKGIKYTKIMKDNDLKSILIKVGQKLYMEK